MKIDFFSYQFPFKHPFVTAKSTYNFRKGILIRLQKSGITAWGEAAPLPGFSQETLQDIHAQIRLAHTQIKTLFSLPISFNDLNRFLVNYKILPSLQFGLFTTSFFYLAQKDPQNYASLLFPEKLSKIRLNAVIDLHHYAFHSRVKELAKTGFQTIKIKTDDDPQFFSKIKSIRDDYPNLTIRLDANQSWSLKQASKFLNKVEPFDIEYCEEPLATPDETLLSTLGQQTNVPIALDESLINTFDLRKAQEIVSILIIKPMMLGITPCWNELQSISKANKAGLVFTSSLESGIGRLMTAYLAASLGSKQTAHGLSTGNLLGDDIWNDGHFINGHSFFLPDINQLNDLMQIEPSTLQLKQIKF